MTSHSTVRVLYQVGYEYEYHLLGTSRYGVPYSESKHGSLILLGTLWRMGLMHGRTAAQHHHAAQLLYHHMPISLSPDGNLDFSMAALAPSRMMPMSTAPATMV